ncbi:MAG TPA: NAD(P)-binding protein [Candidatus Dormibacteraeota bacterium]|nr:NAD(P)-binding protein [Candidatus Dormibacteraeota bacterium]
MTNSGHHFVAVIGGAISGSVATEILADHGIRVAVFEQNTRPYGKIEDGLPRWHVEQRKQEYGRIDARMKKPNVYFIPSTKLGRDFNLPQLLEWGFSAVILANGAWRDRELGVPEAEQYVDKGLVYQNPFIYWYNHKNEKDYRGPRYETPDEAVVVGGGLASLDVVKVLQLENYERALRTRGIQTNMHELEKGIPEVCKKHGIKPEELGVKGCLLIYRRREQDMPLAQPPDNATSEQIAKTEQIRQKMLRLARAKYLFRFQDCRLTTGIIVQNGRLAGLKVVETKIEGRKAEPIPGSEHELRAPLVVSSIGSVPEKLSGINMNGEYYTFAGKDVPRYTAMDRVFGVGNVVTGQGNIRVSLVHSQKVTKRVVDCMKADDGNAGAGSAEQQVASAMNAIGKQIEVIPQLSDDQLAKVERQVHALQQKAGFTSDYDSWIAKVTPPDLE